MLLTCTTTPPTPHHHIIITHFITITNTPNDLTLAKFHAGWHQPSVGCCQWQDTLLAWRTKTVQLGSHIIHYHRISSWQNRKMDASYYCKCNILIIQLQSHTKWLYNKYTTTTTKNSSWHNRTNGCKYDANVCIHVWKKKIDLYFAYCDKKLTLKTRKLWSESKEGNIIENFVYCPQFYKNNIQICFEQHLLETLWCPLVKLKQTIHCIS